MIVRKVTVTKGEKKQVYLEIIERKAGRGKDAEPLARLGPVELLDGRLDGVVKSLGEFCKEDYVAASEVAAERVLTWGPGLVARHLWEELGVGEIISAACGDEVSRSVFVLVANRLVDPEYAFGIDHWLERNHIPGGKRNASKGAGAPRKAGRLDGRGDNVWDRTLQRLASKQRGVRERLSENIEKICGDSEKPVLYEVSSNFIEGAFADNGSHCAPFQEQRRSMRLFVGAVMRGDWALSVRFFGGSQPTPLQIRRLVEDVQRHSGFRPGLVVFPSGTDEEKLSQIRSFGLDYLVRIRRRRDPRAVEVIQQAGRNWDQVYDDAKVQEILLPGDEDSSSSDPLADEVSAERYFLVHSTNEERDEHALRTAVVTRALQAMKQLKEAVESGRLKKPATIMMRAERILALRKGYRYISWRLTRQGELEFWEDERKSSLHRSYEGKSLLKTSDRDLPPADAVRIYNSFQRFERGIGRIFDTAASRSVLLPLPELEENPTGGKAGTLFAGHLLVGQIASLLRTRLQNALLEKRVNLTIEEAIEALRTISVAELRLGDSTHQVVSRGSESARSILRAVGIETPQAGELEGA